MMKYITSLDKKFTDENVQPVYTRTTFWMPNNLERSSKMRDFKSPVPVSVQTGKTQLFENAHAYYIYSQLPCSSRVFAHA